MTKGCPQCTREAKQHARRTNEHNHSTFTYIDGDKTTEYETGRVSAPGSRDSMPEFYIDGLGVKRMWSGERPSRTSRPFVPFGDDE